MAGSWADMTLPDFLSDYFMWSFLLESFSIKNEPFLPAHAQETNGTYNPSFACPLNYSRILFFQFVKIRFLFYLFRFVLSFLFQLVLTTRQTCFHLCHGLQKWYPHTARKNGVWYLNLTGHPYSSGGKVGFLKTLKYIVRDLVRLKRKNFIKAATKNRVRIDQLLCYLIWMGC